MSFDPVMPPYNASDPGARFVSASCLDFLLIELVPLSHRVTHQLDAVAQEQEAAVAAAAGVGVENGVDGVAPVVMDEDEEREAMFRRLEGIGYRVGQGLVERYVLIFGDFGGWMGC